MFNFNEFPAYDKTCKYRFESRPNGDYFVFDKTTGERIPETAMSLDIQAEIKIWAKLWEERCEHRVGTPVNITDNATSNDFALMKDTYEILLAGAIMMIAEQKGINPDTVIPQIQKIITWLEGADFFDTAASARFHDSEPHGLVYHSLKVYNQIILLRELPQFKDCSLAEATIVALAHDWDKIYKYEPYLRNVKNEETGQWEQIPSFRINQKNVPMGRGTTSMFIISKLTQISAEAMLAIRWHMGAWDVSGEDQHDLHHANANYPLVHLIQFADQLSITEYAKPQYVNET